MRNVIFYRTEAGGCPVEDFLDGLNDKHFEKIAWVLKLIGELDVIPVEYFKKLKNTDDIWEIRISFGANIFRILCFLEGKNIIILTNGFVKKSQKTPKQEIPLAERRKSDYLARRK
jgi:phage-related protein